MRCTLRRETDAGIVGNIPKATIQAQPLSEQSWFQKQKEQILVLSALSDTSAPEDATSNPRLSCHIMSWLSSATNRSNHGLIHLEIIGSCPTITISSLSSSGSPLVTAHLHQTRASFDTNQIPTILTQRQNVKQQ